MTGQQLKNSILQWAIQGKLVPQIESEGTAEDLLKEIRAEKERLVKEGKLKKKDLVVKPIEDDEIPFEIPESWRWVRLGEISYLNRGRSQHRPRNDKSLFVDGNVPFVQTGDVANASIYIGKCSSYYNQKGLDQSKLWDKGTLCMTIAANIGDVAILDFDACFPDSVVGFNAYYPIENNLYFLYGLKCYKDILDKKSYSTAQKNINIEILYNLVFPLPPLSEQKRIVAKIEELMPLVEEYGKAQERLETLNRELPEKLKKSVLQEAIMGKLVPQDPTEGTAEELLAEIRKEKEKLVKEGKLKKKDLEVKPIEVDEIPFEIPEGWKWCRLGDLGVFERGSGIKRDETFESGYPCVRYGEMYTKYRYSTTFSETHSYTSKEVFYKCRKARKGDLFMALTGENKEEIALTSQYVGEAEVAIGGDLCRFSPLFSYGSYLVYLINSSFAINKKRDLATGDIIVHISTDKLSSIPVPLPPLAEQKRIVAKLEEVMEKIEGMKK